VQAVTDSRGRDDREPVVWVDALRGGHDRLRAFVGGASADDLSQPSMCTEWNVARVLGHLGSGAEIGLATVTGADVDREAVWGRWNAMESGEMASSFVAADERLVSWFEGLSAEELTTRQVQMPFLPAPINAAEAAGFRLSEVSLHSWDVFAAFDPTARVAPDATDLLVDRLPMMVGFVARFTPRETRPATTTTIGVQVSEPDRRYELELGDSADLRPATGRPTDGQLDITGEALLRLAAGRLRPDREAGTTISGSLSLDDLRRAFPGY
jgi:uncharacterized protein (TIGR03083 family)